ncbi:MAG: type II secretion system F family protein [Polaromonas sp.]|nr:type II secretion system F family protein [Polaromonas sp.]
MFQAMGNYSFLIILALALASLLLLILAGWQIWQSYKGPGVRKIEKRLQALSAAGDDSAQSQLLKERLLSQVPRLEQLLLRMPRALLLDAFIVQSGLNWTVSKLLQSSALLGLIAGLVLGRWLLLSTALAAAAGVAVGLLPWLYVSFRRQRRLARFEAQLPEALDLMLRALRAGHSFASALQMVGEEMSDPVASEFSTVHDEVNFGVAVEQALTNLTARVPLTDLRYFVVAVLIQRESGGNLTEVLGNLSRLVRERLKLRSKVKVMSADGRLSAWILTLMPFALAALMNAFNPDFMAPLWTDPMGVVMLQYLLTMTVVGVVVMQKIIRIRI